MVQQTHVVSAGENQFFSLFKVRKISLYSLEDILKRVMVKAMTKNQSLPEGVERQDWVQLVQ